MSKIPNLPSQKNNLLNQIEIEELEEKEIAIDEQKSSYNESLEKENDSEDEWQEGFEVGFNE